MFTESILLHCSFCIRQVGVVVHQLANLIDSMRTQRIQAFVRIGRGNAQYIDTSALFLRRFRQLADVGTQLYRLSFVLDAAASMVEMRLPCLFEAVTNRSTLDSKSVVYEGRGKRKRR